MWESQPVSHQLIWSNKKKRSENIYLANFLNTYDLYGYSCTFTFLLCINIIASIICVFKYTQC